MPSDQYAPYIKVKQHLAEHPRLRLLLFELTTQCNLKCRHCGGKCPSRDQYDQIDVDAALRTIDTVADHMPPGSVMFCLTGGEPLLHRDWLTIGRHIASKGFPWGMTTNGTLITPQTITQMKEAGMQTISVSIDGLKESHEWQRGVSGCFDKAVCGLRLLADSKAFQCVQATTVVNTRNLHELSLLRSYLERLGVNSWKIVATEPIGDAVGQRELFLSPAQYEQMLEFIYQNRQTSEMEITYACPHFLPEKYETGVRGFHFHCGAGTLVASISAKGEILACLDIDDRERTIQGNIDSDNFWDVWSNGFRIFRQPRDLSRSQCAQCPEKEFCRGDSWHTWDFERQRPKVCLRRMGEGGAEEHGMGL